MSHGQIIGNGRNQGLDYVGLEASFASRPIRRGTDFFSKYLPDAVIPDDA